MPVPAPNLTPPFNVVRLSHVEYGVTDLARARAFWVDTLGLQVTGEADGAMYLRAMEERGHHCVILRQGAPVARFVAFKLWSDADLDLAADWFAAQNRPVAWVDRPFQGRTLATADPFGMPLEFYAVMDRLPSNHQKYSLYKGAKPLRIDHFNCFSPDVDRSVAFWNAMGFRVSE